MKIKYLITILAIAFAGCTKQEMARNYGGTATENFPAGRKLLNVTWKEDHLWYLTRPMIAPKLMNLRNLPVMDL